MIPSNIAFIAEGLGLLGSSLQLRHTLFARSVMGLSGITYTLGVSANISWVIYGLQNEIIALILSNTILAIIGGAILARIFLTKDKRLLSLGGVLVFAVLLACTYYLFEKYSGWIAFGFNTLASLPQLYKSKTVKSMRGVSLYGQLIWVCSEIATIIYASMISAWPLAIGAIRGLATNSYIAVQTKNKS